MCKYSDGNIYKCPHERLENSDYCIFHLQDDNKDIDEFNKGIKEILETEEDSINLNGFYFPPESSDFFSQIFPKKIDFSNVIFSGRANFGYAEFSGEANFLRTKFSEKAHFFNAKFSGEVYFFKATFSGEASFEEATFSRCAIFIDATFSKADFRKATFSRYAYFMSATFSGNVNFRDAIFSVLADFDNAELTGKFVVIPKKSETLIFENTYFSDNVRIKADLSKCSFANSNIERVDMTDSSWMRDDDKPKKSFSAFHERIRNKVGLSETSIIIWEEHQGELKSDWKELEGIYRRLKQSSQKFGDNSTAGKLYYQEMECRRKQLRGIKKLYWDVFYKELCGYGEKPFKVIWASLFLILLFAYSYLFSGIEFVGSSILNVPPNVIQYKLSLNSTGIQWLMSNFDSVKDDFLLCLYTSVITFTTLGYGDVRPIGLSRIFASLEAGLGIIMTALFIFVFSRRMLR